MLKKLIPLLLLVTLISCSNEDTDVEIDPNLSLSDQIDQLIDQNRYETALDLLEDEDPQNPDTRFLLEKTHLNYGLHSMNTFDQTEMRTRMNNALIQFTEVLKLNPDNQMARDQIIQIMDIYSTIPDRQPEPEVLEALREVGFDY
ncbi:tetratricopeptide repeat protein [Rhodohalobacter barkolensis]|uniref:Tetratricopeptide repeat protein n=1 Tax=Rhodohalobacter barkolensis TaxID=2053187 RepID=A0A2N0VEQ3_9BACT|nr:hypothetical protein [Rhodohalobacter barkolensis]PKD42663.1 hypothetical protein CWD77_14750 [Rhodohalobacter barkolensis]